MGDRNTPLTIESGRRDEPERAAARGFGCLYIVANQTFAVLAMEFGDAGPIVDDHALRFVVQADEKLVVHRPRLDGDTECIMQRHVAANADARQCTADKKIAHSSRPLYCAGPKDAPD